MCIHLLLAVLDPAGQSPAHLRVSEPSRQPRGLDFAGFGKRVGLLQSPVNRADRARAEGVALLRLLSRQEGSS